MPESSDMAAHVLSKQWSCGTFAAGISHVQNEAVHEELDIEEEELQRQIEDHGVKTHTSG